MRTYICPENFDQQHLGQQSSKYTFLIEQGALEDQYTFADTDKH